MSFLLSSASGDGTEQVFLSCSREDALAKRVEQE
jgi:hypothetical protein